MTSRIGILGGTFDPIHIGHLAIAEDVRVTLQLDRVLFVPAAQQPFKRERIVASAADRLAMVERACAENTTFTASPVEIARAGISYTVTTLETLTATLDGEVFFILGADALAELPRWHQANRLSELAHFVTVKRPGFTLAVEQLRAALPGFDQRLTVLDGPRLDISSSEIRERAALGRSLRYLVPDSVIDYLSQHNLYRAAD